MMQVSISSTIIFIGACLLLLFLPLPYGSVEGWSVFVFETATLLLAGIYLAGKFREQRGRGRKDRRDLALNSRLAGTSGSNTEIKTEKPASEPRLSGSGYGFGLRAAGILLALFFGAAVFQLLPIPLSLLRSFSPETAAVYDWSGLAESGTNFFRVSFIPSATRSEFIKYACYFLFGFLLFKTIKSRRQAEALVLVILASGLFQAFYGLAEYFGGTDRIFSYQNVSGRGSAFGTFINRDHYSGFLEMIFPLCIGYLLAKADFFSMKNGLSLRQKIVWFSQEKLQKVFILGVVAVILGVGLFFSRSRSGVIILVITFFLMMTALSAGRRSKRNKVENNRHPGEVSGSIRGSLSVSGEESKSGAASGLENVIGHEMRNDRERRSANRRMHPQTLGHTRYIKMVRTTGLVLAFTLIFIGIKPVIERFTLDSLISESRPRFYALTLDMIGDFPVLGTGAGTYIHAYTRYEQEDLSGILHHAHNDYLEMLAEMGMVGGCAIILAAFIALGWMLARWLKRRDEFVRGVGLGCMAGVTAVLIHSVSDFILRTPAVAVYFVALYALGMRMVLLRQRTERRQYR